MSPGRIANGLRICHPSTESRGDGDAVPRRCLLGPLPLLIAVIHPTPNRTVATTKAPEQPPHYCVVERARRDVRRSCLIIDAVRVERVYACERRQHVNAFELPPDRLLAQRRVPAVSDRDAAVLMPIAWPSTKPLPSAPNHSCRTRTPDKGGGCVLPCSWHYHDLPCIVDSYAAPTPLALIRQVMRISLQIP